MQTKEQRGINVRRMEKRREVMADGRRYIIYYTFEPAEAAESESGKAAAEPEMQDKERENV